MKGKLLTINGPFAASVREYEIPVAGDGGMVIKVEAAMICGSDGHYIRMQPKVPFCDGHEFAGEIISMGKNANKEIYSFGGELKVGDRVVVYPHITCGHCRDCLTYGNGTCGACEEDFLYGSPYSCEKGEESLNTNPELFPHFKGGFAEYVYIFPGTYVWKIPNDMPGRIAALLDPVAVAVRAIEMAAASDNVWTNGISTSTRVLVIGAGPIGIIAAMLLKHMGVREVIITDGIERKLQLALEIAKVDRAINVGNMKTEDRIHHICEITEGGADIVLQCANHISATIEGLQMVRMLGTYIEVGVTKSKFTGGKRCEVDIPRLFFERNARIAGLIALKPSTYDKAFELLKKHKELPFEKLITHEFHELDQYLETIKKMGDEDYLKAVYIPAT